MCRGGGGDGMKVGTGGGVHSKGRLFKGVFINFFQNFLGRFFKRAII